MSASKWGPWGRGPASGRAIGGLKHAVIGGNVAVGQEGGWLEMGCA